MPLSKCIEVVESPWKDRDLNERIAFRCTFKEIGKDVFGEMYSRTFYVSIFGQSAADDARFKAAIAANKLPNCLVNSFPVKVKPYCRVHVTDNARQERKAGKWVIDPITGKPQIFNTINVHFLSDVDPATMAEIPGEAQGGIAAVTRIANDRRKYYATTVDTRINMCRYYDIGDAGYGSEDANIIAQLEEDEAKHAPTPEPPVAAPNKPGSPTGPVR